MLFFKLSALLKNVSNSAHLIVFFAPVFSSMTHNRLVIRVMAGIFFGRISGLIPGVYSEITGKVFDVVFRIGYGKR